MKAKSESINAEEKNRLRMGGGAFTNAHRYPVRNVMGRVIGERWGALGLTGVTFDTDDLKFGTFPLDTQAIIAYEED